MRITYDGERFISYYSHAGFFHSDKKPGMFFTYLRPVVRRVQDYCDRRARRQLEVDQLFQRALDENFERVYKESKALGFTSEQLKAFKYAMQQNASLLYVPPGAGKTAIASAIAKTLKGNPIIYVTPPFLVANVTAQFKRWAPEIRIGVVDAKLPLDYSLSEIDVLLFPDSLVHRDNATAIVETFLLAHAADATEHVVIIDECHRFKTYDAKRTQAVTGYHKNREWIPGLFESFDRIILMSGSPMPNRPINLFPVLNFAAPETIGYRSMMSFGQRYCGAYRGPWGWDFSGVSNFPELVSRVVGKFIFVADRRKALKGVPEIIEDLYYLSTPKSPERVKLEKELIKKFGSSVDVTRELLKRKAGGKKDDDETLNLMTYRRLLGLEKIGGVADLVIDLIENSDDSVVLFGLHVDTINAMASELAKYSPIVITGKTPSGKRQELVDEFQNNPKRRVIIGNIDALGIGYTLIKANHVVFLEWSYVPGNNEQAMQRVARLGQTKKCYAYYALYEGSIDEKVLRNVNEKRETIALLK